MRMGRCTRLSLNTGNYWQGYNSQFYSTQNQSYPHHGSVEHGLFLANSQLNIVITQLYIPRPLHENDQNIMGEILKIEKSPIAIKRVNQCRLFLQVPWLSEMTDARSNIVPPGLLEYTDTHTSASKSNLHWPIHTLPPPKSWEIWEKLIQKRFLLSKLGCLGTAALEDPLGLFLQTHNNHCTWHWEQTGANSIVENTYLFNKHQQVHYSAQFTRHQIKVNKKYILHKTQPILHCHPITMQQSTSTTLLFAQPCGAYEIYNLHKPKPFVICDLYKVAMLKYVKYRAMPQADTAVLVHHTIIISITSKQWGARADFGWCTTFQEDIVNNPLGSRASTVMINSSYNDHTRADLHAIQAALLFLQMQLKHIWHQQMQFRVITKHKSLTQCSVPPIQDRHPQPTVVPQPQLGDTPVNKP
jgi:hypothetical protein